MGAVFSNANAIYKRLCYLVLSRVEHLTADQEATGSNKKECQHYNYALIVSFSPPRNLQSAKYSNTQMTVVKYCKFAKHILPCRYVPNYQIIHAIWLRRGVQAKSEPADPLQVARP